MVVQDRPGSVYRRQRPDGRHEALGWPTAVVGIRCATLAKGLAYPTPLGGLRRLYGEVELPRRPGFHRLGQPAPGLPHGSAKPSYACFL